MTEENKNEGKVNLGIVGIGNMGSSHAKMLQEDKVPGARLAAVCDLNAERLEAFPGAEPFSDAETMFASGTVDAVVIATPHPSHVPLGVAAMQAGLHVLVEKPIGVHKAVAEELIQAHQGRDTVFAAMFNQRTDPKYQWLKQRIEDGTLGAIHRINWIITDWFRTELYYSSGDWRATWKGEGGGVLLNQCPHQLDLWQWLFGMPTTVRSLCQIGRFHNIEVEDDVTTLMEYDGGATGVFVTTTGETPGTNRLEVAADHGRIIVEGNTITFDRNETPSREFCRTSDKSFARPKTETEATTFETSGEQHLGILKNFADAIRNGDPLVAPAEEGIRSVELGNAMLYSGLTGEPVSMPLDGAAYAAKLEDLIQNSTFQKTVTDVGPASTDEMSSSF